MSTTETTPKTTSRKRAGSSKPRESTPLRTRTCVGCSTQDALDALVRLIVTPDGAVLVDLAGGSFGRGAHVHAKPGCIDIACRVGLPRAFKRSIAADRDSLADSIGRAADRRAEGLLLGARRAGHVALGADAAEDAILDEDSLLVVASDAGTVASRPRFTRAIAEGRAVVFMDKARLGVLLGREEIAVSAVKHAGIAAELRRVRAWAESARSRAWSSREVQ